MTEIARSPLVSVVIAAHNAEAFIGKAVRSALDQTLRDIEVFVVDDGSRDHTATVALAEAAGDARFLLLSLAANGGAAAARNAALAVARGRWIAVLDADDAFLAERLERLVAAAEATDADLLADNITLLHADGREEAAFTIPARRAREPLDVRTFVALDSPGLETLPVGFMQPLMRRAFLERYELRYPEDIYSGEDFDLYVRCLLRGARLLFVDESYYRALIRPDSLSRADPERNNAALRRSLEHLISDALACGNRGAARMLARRARDLELYGEYSRLSDALHHRRFVDAARLLRRLLPQPYTWRRFSMAARRRIVRPTA